MSSLDNPLDFSEFLAQVNCRHVPAFFLGCVFLAAVNAMTSSSFLQNLFYRLRESLSTEEPVNSEKVSTDSSISLYIDNRLLIFLLSFCFASASITLFASLLSFSPSSGGACAFVVAWGGITSQLARVVGLIILFLELRRLGIQRWESFCFISLLVIGTVLVFVDRALATGVTIPLKGSKHPNHLGILLCDRKHFLRTALAPSLIYILLEGYSIHRFWLLLIPGFLKLGHRLSGLNDYRMRRAMALLLFDLLTIVPAAINTNIMAEFLPLSIGSILVIWSFRLQALLPADGVPTSIMSVHRSLSYSTAPSTMRRSIAPTVYSVDPGETGLSSHMPLLPYHPFSSKSLNDPTPEGMEWSMPRTARSSRTIDTVSAISIRDAIVQVAKRAAHPFAQELDKFPVPPTTSPRPMRVITSHTAVAEKLELETKMPPKALARPRLMMIPSPDKWEPDSSVLRPLMQKSPLFRLTPTFVPGSHLSMSSSESNSRTVSRSSKSTPSSPGLPRSSLMSVPTSMPSGIFGARRDRTLTRNDTFGTS